jgi:hypothetical protein
MVAGLAPRICRGSLTVAIWNQQIIPPADGNAVPGDWGHDRSHWYGTVRDWHLALWHIHSLKVDYARAGFWGTPCVSFKQRAREA